MRVFSKSSKYKVDEENPYWISFSDLMSALLVVFILAAVSLIIELTQTQKIIEDDIDQLRNAEKARRDILNEVRDELSARGIKVLVTENSKVLNIPEETLSFKSNSYQMPWQKEKRDAIVLIGDILHKAIYKRFDSTSNVMRYQYLDTVFIEGHTDNVPATRYEGGNWELSTKRAISLWRFWGEQITKMPSFDEMVNEDGEKLFSVSGYAESRAVKPNDSAENRKANRRIEIRFTIVRPEISQLEDIIKK